MRLIILTPSPRWVVLLTDLIIVTVSCILTYHFNPSIGANDSFIYSPIVKSAIIVGIYLAFSITLRTYKYIARLSVIEDVYRLALLVSLSSALLTVIALIFEYAIGYRYFSIWNIFTIGMFTFATMMSIRLILKYLYNRICGTNAPRKPVIILGSALNSFTFASALKNEINGQFEPVAMLSLSDKEIGSIVNGIPILKYNPDHLNEIFQSYNCDTLLFLATQIEMMRNGLADEFLNNHIKLLMLNQVEEFDINGSTNPNLSLHVKNIKIEDLLGRKQIDNDNPYIEQQITDQTILITGAAGSIGSEIVRQVAQLNAKEIILVDQAETPMHEIQIELEENYPTVKTHLFIGDITNRSRMEEVFKKYHPRFVYHAAAYKHVPMMEHNPSEAILTNVFGTKNIADLSIAYDVEKFVMISTDKAVNPTNIMGASKRIAEIYVQSLFLHNKRRDKKSTQFITTRFGNVLGSNGSVIPRFRKQIEEGGPVTVTHREIIRYFMTIPEACSLVLEAGCMGNGGEIYIFDMGKPVKIYDLACRMITLAGLKPNEDIKIIETGLRPGEKLYEELLNNKEQTIATHHKKIKIAKVRTYEYDNVINHLNSLLGYANKGKIRDMVTEMKHIVPEFKSQNSQWSEIDKEINSDEHVKETNPAVNQYF